MIRDIFYEIYPLYIKTIKKEDYKKEYNNYFKIEPSKELDFIDLRIDFNKCNLSEKGKIILLILGKENKDKDLLIKFSSMKYSPKEIKEEINDLKKQKIIKEDRGLIKGDLEKILKLWDLT